MEDKLWWEGFTSHLLGDRLSDAKLNELLPWPQPDTYPNSMGSEHGIAEAAHARQEQMDNTRAKLMADLAKMAMDTVRGFKLEAVFNAYDYTETDRKVMNMDSARIPTGLDITGHSGVNDMVQNVTAGSNRRKLENR